MSVNLNKNKAKILDAWKKVTENEDGYDWALFGYEGKSLDLKVDAIGSGGIVTLAEEINEGKIQYAYVRILDPNTKLVKFVLINFQGEAVLDLVHKGTCSNHIRDITHFLKNHLTITVSTLEDLDEEAILKKMSKITSAYNFQERAAPTEEKFAIGTNYSKVVPTKEINSTKRDEFWKNEEEIEKARVARELEIKKLANLKIEEDRLKREQSEHLKREQRNKEPEIKKNAAAPIIPWSPVENVVDKEEISRPSAEEMRADRRKEAQELISNRTNDAGKDETSKPRAEVMRADRRKEAQELIGSRTNNAEADETSKPRAEEMRADRRKEAQELIGNRVNTAKAMFQQQASQSTIPVSTAPPAKPIRKTINKVEPEPAAVEPQPVSAIPAKIELLVEEPAPAAVDDDEDEQFSTIKRSPKTPTTPDNKQDNFIATTDYDNNHHQHSEDNGLQQNQQQQLLSLEPQKEALPEGELLKAIALYDYQAVDDTEISFDPGDIITHIDQIDEGWWQGFSERFGTYGLFPANYVELIN